VAEASEVKLPDVMTVDEIDRFAVTVPLIAGSEPMVTELPTVTLPICAVPAPMVTVPEMAGRELIVRLFPTVTVPPTVTALARSWVLVRMAEVA